VNLKADGVASLV